MKKFWIIAKIFVTLMIARFIIGRIDHASFSSVLHDVEWKWYIASFLIMIVQNLLSSEALRALSRSVRMDRAFWPTLRTTFWSFYFSFLGNWVGGVVRWRGIAGDDRRRGEALFAILADNYLMVASYTLMFLACYWSDLNVWHPWERKVLGGYSAVFASGVLGGFVFLRVRAVREWLDQVLRAFSGTGRSSWWSDRFGDWVRVWSVSQTTSRDFWKAAFLWVLHAALMVLSLKVMLLAVRVELPVVSVMWIAALLRMVQVIPITLFGVGVVEGILTLVAGRMGAAPESGLAAGLLLSSCSIVAALGGGVWYLFYHLRLLVFGKTS